MKAGTLGPARTAIFGKRADLRFRPVGDSGVMCASQAMIALLAAIATGNPPTEQQADFDCLRLAATMKALHIRWTRRLPWEAASLMRLERADPTHDWTKEAEPLGDITYGDFTHRLEACQERAVTKQR